MYMVFIMKSRISNHLPGKLGLALLGLGFDIQLARKKRGLTIAMMAERVGVAVPTYRRIEQGDPSVSLGAVAMTLFVLGFAERIKDLADPGTDDQGLALDAVRLPKRVRTRKQAPAL